MLDILLILVIIGIGIYLFIKAYRHIFDDTHYKYNSNQTKKYRVRKKSDDIIAANKLTNLSSKLSTLVNYIYDNKLKPIPLCTKLKQRWKKIKLRETGKYDDSAAYTVNKSDELRICLRNNKTNQFENENTMMFVALHELAHIMSDSYGHNKEFMDNFKFLLHIAVKLKIYEPENFSKKPTNYCGTDITSSPLT
tara:strand:- start:407 stop:988 length:582 start_codon:yes stop_codon:yes gene_type:complete